MINKHSSAKEQDFMIYGQTEERKRMTKTAWIFLDEGPE